MAICYQYESANFQCSALHSLWLEAESGTPLILRASNTATKLSSMLFNFCNFTQRLHKNDLRKSEIPGGGGGVGDASRHP